VGRIRALTSADVAAARDLLAVDPISHCFVDSRVRTSGVDPWRLGGEMWGYVDDDDTLISLLYIGANLVPVATTEASRAAFADRLRQTGRRSSSIVGIADEVLDLWRLLEPAWGPCRELRDRQPLLVMDEDPRGEIDPAVRFIGIDELDVLVPACIDMFTQEVGVSPVAGGGGVAYRSRIADLVRSSRSIGRIENGIVMFKAEIGSSTPLACQVQGVWVDPSMRGRGISVPAMAATVRLARTHIAPVVSLYVNDFNTVARRTYESCGFRQHQTFATVLF
jgi:predicted GNAT family acetyltransferase